MKRNIVVNATINSCGFALIIGATAAMAVAPHIAAPDDIKIERVLFRLNILDIKSPPKNDKKTNKVIQLK